MAKINKFLCNIIFLCLLCQQLKFCWAIGLLEDLIHVSYKNLNITEFCKTDLNILENGLHNREIWAMKLVDASGRVGSGFVWGNNYWLGSKHACNRLRSPVPIVLSYEIPKNHQPNLTDFKPPMDISYRVAYVKHYSEFQLDISTLEKTIIHLGFCLPKSCDNIDLTTLTEQMLNDHQFGGSELIGDAEKMYLLSTKELGISKEFWWTPIVIGFLCIFLAHFLMTSVASILHLLQTMIKSYTKIIVAHDTKNGTGGVGTGSNITNGNINNNIENGYPMLKVQEKKQLNLNICDRLIAAFSISENSTIITSDSLGNDSIEVIHGMRAIGMFWIIGGHIFFYGPAAIDNLQLIFTYAEVWFYQPIFAVAMAVDSYFVISGLVLAYLFFQSEKKTKQESGAAKFFKSVINRYMRLTPTYMVALLLTGFLSFWLRDMSPYWMIEHNDINCPKNWWQNLLYINNFYPMADMCMSWSWFLSVDFQCFVLSTLLLIITTKSKHIGLTLFGIIFLGSIILTGYHGYTLKYSLSLDAQYSTIDYLYAPTTTRIGAYFCGIFSGWFLSTRDRQWNIKKKYLTILWMTAPMLNLIMIFGSTKKSLTPMAALFYTSLGKITWAIGISFMIIACATNNGGIVNRILSAKKLLPFSRMSYSAYLLNPLCIMCITMLSEVPMHLDYFSLIVSSLGVIFYVFIIAFIFMLLFENPLIRLAKLLQGQ